VIRVRTVNTNTVERWNEQYATVESANRWSQWGAEDLVAAVAEAIPLNSHVLDVGVGAGHGPAAVAHRRTDVVWSGLDFSANALRYLRSSKKVPWRDLLQGDLVQGLRLPARAYETVLCTEVLEHLENPAAGLLELVRVCRSRLIVSVPRENVVDSDFHLWAFSEADIVQMLGAYGTVRTSLARSRRQIVGVLNKRPEET